MLAQCFTREPSTFANYLESLGYLPLPSTEENGEGGPLRMWSKEGWSSPGEMENLP